MQKVRKLHGELLLGNYGTKIVELAASWFVVLLMTGLYIWWPARSFSIKGFFWIRMAKGRRTMMRDIHAVVGFWTSLVLLVILAGGLPWTDVFGDNYKKVLQWTDTGKPAHYSNSKGLTSAATEDAAAFTLDQMVKVAKQLALPGIVTITLPKNNEGVFTVSNQSEELRSESVYHVDQYNGQIVKSLHWEDVGVMAAGRTVVMRLHQGEFFGFANWLIVLVTAILLAIASVSAMLSYLLRKPSKGWGIPSVPANFVVGKIIIIMIIVLGIVLPLFGLSVILICLLQCIWTLINRARTSDGGVRS